MKTLTKSVFLLALFGAGCGSSEKGSTRNETAPPVAETRESLYEKGRAWYVEGRHDSAARYLERSRSVDPAFLPPLKDLAEIYYVAGMSAGAENERTRNFRSAVGCYAAIDSLGKADEAVYDRLTELTRLLGNTDLFLVYAGKHATLYPGDRQLYNLGLGYFDAKMFQKVIETQKDGIRQYPHSPYLAGFYRLLGDGYYSIDRQQSAERTYEEGIRVVETEVQGMKAADPGFTATQQYRQLADNYRAMLSSLKKIYRLHGKQEKLEQIENRPDLGP